MKESSPDLMQKCGLDYKGSLHLSTAIGTEAKEIISTTRTPTNTP